MWFEWLIHHCMEIETCKLLKKVFFFANFFVHRFVALTKNCLVACVMYTAHTLCSCLFFQPWSWKLLWGRKKKHYSKSLFCEEFFSGLFSFFCSNPAFIMQIFNIVLSRMLFRKICNLENIKLWTKSTAYGNEKKKQNKNTQFNVY